jgi:hypothetical protein
MKTHETKSIKKLSIGKETITSLNQLHLNKVIGGNAIYTTCYNQPTNSMVCASACCG